MKKYIYTYAHIYARDSESSMSKGGAIHIYIY